jgi:O-antigen ligase
VIAGIICTVSRKGAVTAALTFFIYYALKGRFKKVVLLALATGVLILMLAGYSVISERFAVERIDHDYSYKLLLVNAGLKMFVTSPIVGLGFRGYYESLPDYIGGMKYDAHNIFITALTNYGILGFIPFLGIFIYPLWISYNMLRKKIGNILTKESKDMSIICMCSVIPFMVNGYFGGGLFYEPEILFLFYTNISLALVEWYRLSNEA